MSGAVRPAMPKMVRPTRAGRRQAGMAYLALLIVVAAMSAALGVTGSLWQQAQLREKERELLFVGMQYRRAIQRYYEASSGRYPPSIDMLLLDDRALSVRRYLRKPYRDPMTNSREWGILMAPQGGIIGVHSLSEEKPIKQENFPAELMWQGGKMRYAEWAFVYIPSQSVVGVTPR
jgi:hypothetical protein